MANRALTAQKEQSQDDDDDEREEFILPRRKKLDLRQLDDDEILKSRNHDDVYKDALDKGAVDVAYSRIMFLGASGVGKTSLKRSLMRQPWPESGATSTIVADLHSVRPVNYEWMGAGQQQWEEVTHDGEINEIAQLLAAVYKDKGFRNTVKMNDDAGRLLNAATATAVANATSLYKTSSIIPPKDVSHDEVSHFESTSVKSTLSEAIARAKSIDNLSQLDIQPYLHVWDCGGQPVFLETLPAFFTSRTMFLLLFDASKDFNSKWQSVQYHDGNVKVEENENISTIDLLLQWMANIYAHLVEHDAEGVLAEYPRVMVIGTRGDTLNESQKESKKKEFFARCKGKAYMELFHDFMIVDNTLAKQPGEEGEDPCFADIRDAITEFTTKKLVVKTNINWVLFRKVIQGLGRNVISPKEAHAIGVACKIPHKDISKVLLFYHDLGVLLYYPHIKGLQKSVIVNPKWLVNMLGKVLTLAGREEYRTGHMWEVLREYGILVQPLYKGAWKDCEGVDPEAMVELLTYFRLAAPVKTKVYHDYNVKQYFVPAVLPIFNGDLSAVPSGYKEKATPLHIVFSTKFVPPGFFTRFVSAVVESPNCEVQFRDGVYRNRISFRYGEPPIDYAILTEMSHAIQVDIMRYVPNTTNVPPFYKVCKSLFKFLKACINIVRKVLSTKMHYEMKFICCSSKCKAELHYLMPAHGQKQDVHVRCEDDKEYRELLLNESYWFSVGHSLNEEILSEPILWEISKEVGFEKASELAANLNMTRDLEAIRHDHELQKQPVFHLLYNWKRGAGRHDDLAKVLKDMGLDHASEMIAPAQDSESDDDDISDIAPNGYESQPEVHLNPQSEGYQQLTDGDLYQCSCHINNIATLAGVLDVTDDELITLQRQYSDKKIQACQLLKKWRESNDGPRARQDLSQLLLQLEFTKAAKSLQAESDSTSWGCTLS